ncbi:MAG: hypothetical protein AAFX08_02700 [Pseudomonadota bacterium]
MRFSRTALRGVAIFADLSSLPFRRGFSPSGIAHVPQQPARAVIFRIVPLRHRALIVHSALVSGGFGAPPSM